MADFEIVGEFFTRAARVALDHTKAFIAENAKAVLNDRDFATYMSGLEVTLDNELFLEIKFTTPAARRLEEGHASFDMKERLLASPKALENKAKSANGVAYLDVPFRMVPPRPAPAGNARQRVPQYVADAMNALRGGNTRDRLRAPKGTFDGVTERPYRSDVDNIFEGLLMHGDYQMAADPQTFTTRFATIRRVSGNSPTDKWIYPARPGLNLAEDAKLFYNELLEAVIADMVP